MTSMRTFLDITGQQFGRLTVLRREEQSANRERLWLCRCNCEEQNTKLVTGSALRRGDTRSCGCIPRGAAQQFDLTGQVFGALTVVRRVIVGHKSKWLCQCTCGPDRTRIADTDQLRSGRAVYCDRTYHEGNRAENLSGHVFNRLTVLRQADNRPGTLGAWWLCRCSCEKQTEKVIAARTLKSGHAQSCGCLQRERAQCNAIDITGFRSGKLIALRRSLTGKKYGGNAMWTVQCDCDPEGVRLVTVAGSQMLNGYVGSCGCASKTGEIVCSEKARKGRHDIWLARYQSDPKFVLNVRVKALMRQTLKNKGAYKTQRTFKTLDFTIDELEAHLKTTTPPGFTWEDFLSGVLHIDHVIPIAEFDYEKDTDPGFKQAWALSNLQLLTGEDNRDKRDKLDWIAPYANRQNGTVLSGG